ncbi:MAG: hypothetical protein ACLFWL_04285 [Candidatus Brocadiia bacterium]
MLFAIFGFVYPALIPCQGAESKAKTICIEAEHANSLRYPFVVARFDKASGKLGLAIPEGAGSMESFGGARIAATYNVKLPGPGKWRAWLRVKWHGICSNSIFFGVGEGKLRKVAGGSARKWQWLSAGNWSIKKQDVVVQIVDREDGVAVDQILFRNNQAPPEEMEKPNLIPGCGTEDLPARLFLGVGSGGLPPTDFALHHGRTHPLPLKPIPRFIVQKGRTTRLAAWLRNNPCSSDQFSVSLSTTAPVEIQPGQRQTFALAPQRPLRKLDFRILPTKHTARRTYRMAIRLRHPNGKIETHKVLLERPFQWLVTNAIACPDSLGLETPSGIENKLTNGFPGPADGVSWQVAPSESVSRYGLLNMRKAVKNSTYVMAYAYTCVRSPEEGTFLFEVRHDDMIRVWLNGKKTFTSLQSAPSSLTRKLVKVHLNKGLNHILVKIAQKKNYWEFGLRILDLKTLPAHVEGVPTENLIVKSKKP